MRAPDMDMDGYGCGLAREAERVAVEEGGLVQGRAAPVECEQMMMWWRVVVVVDSSRRAGHVLSCNM